MCIRDRYHITNAKNHGVTKTEMIEIITHLAFYVGWPNAWAVFPMVREAYENEKVDASDSLFGIGEPNDAFAQYFVGQSYLKPLNVEAVSYTHLDVYKRQGLNVTHSVSHELQHFVPPTSMHEAVQTSPLVWYSQSLTLQTILLVLPSIVIYPPFVLRD